MPFLFFYTGTESETNEQPPQEPINEKKPEMDEMKPQGKNL